MILHYPHMHDRIVCSRPDLIGSAKDSCIVFEKEAMCLGGAFRYNARRSPTRL